MSFQFIDNTAIDHAARKRIRIQAATGKNVGKKLTRPSRRKALEAKANVFWPLESGPNIIRSQNGLQEEKDKPPEIERQIGVGMCFPVPLSSETSGIVRKAFSFISGPRGAPELTDAIEHIDGSSSIWVQYMLIDEAYFHCTMATSITVLNRLVTRPENTTEAIRHLSQGFRLLNEKLSGGDAVSDKTIAAVVGMAQYERLQAQYERGLIHIQGLRQMANLRGGIRQLRRNMPELAKKIFRADLEYSLQLGTETLFSVADVVFDSAIVYGYHSISTKKGDQIIVEDDDSQLSQRLQPDIRTLFVEIRCVASLLNEASGGHRPKLDGAQFHETIIQLGYRILSISTISGARPSDYLNNLVHVALTAFVVTLLVGLDRKVADNPLLSDLARSSALEEQHMEKNSAEVLLWLLFIGSVSLFKEQDDVWLVAKTSQIMGCLEVCTWVDVRRVLSRYSWVEALHSKSGYSLWQKAATHKR